MVTTRTPEGDPLKCVVCGKVHLVLSADDRFESVRIHYIENKSSFLRVTGSVANQLDFEALVILHLCQWW